MSLDDIGLRMSPGEALGHVQVLMKDPTSWLHAAVGGWEHPASHEFFVMADVFDAIAKAHFRNPKPYPRPTPSSETRVEQLGDPIAPADLAGMLRAFGRDVPADIAALETTGPPVG